MLRTALLFSALATVLHVPLEPGLTIVTALSDRAGDYESIKTVDSVTPDAVTLAYSADVPDAGGRGKAQKVRTGRIVKKIDLQSAHEYMQIFNPSSPQVFAGTTAIGASASVLNELRTKGRTAFSFQTPGRQASTDDVLAALAGGGGKDARSIEDIGRRLDASKATGTLVRVEPADVAFPVIVNGARTTLPAIHARGTFGEEAADFYFLDDADNPIALKWTTGTATGTLQVTQISWPVSRPPQIEQALNDAGRADVYGIYFDFNSATIRPESEPTLKDIAGAMTKHPSWKLTVGGHTDNVGGDTANMDLSRRRANAVKDALVARFHVDASRLVTAGHGASEPKETNATAEGRARNRRVELVRQ